MEEFEQGIMGGGVGLEPFNFGDEVDRPRALASDTCKDGVMWGGGFPLRKAAQHVVRRDAQRHFRGARLFRRYAGSAPPAFQPRYSRGDRLLERSDVCPQRSRAQAAE